MKEQFKQTVFQKSYLIEEHQDVIFDNEKLDEWKKLSEDLGASGQMSLISENKSFFPFPIMTEAEAEIYNELLNRKDDYKEYSAEAIPLQGLSLIALCEKEKYFDKIQIWYSREMDDPFIVGLRYRTEKDRKDENGWRMDKYLIFQWGRKLKKLVELLPLYEKKKKDEIQDNFDYSMRNLESNLKKFKLQIESYQ